MWVPDLNSPPLDHGGTTSAVLPSLVPLTSADGKPLVRVNVLPFGKFGGPATGEAWNMDAASAQDVLRATRDFQRGLRMVVDYDHQSIFSLRNNGAIAGYIAPASLTVLDDGIYGELEWTPVGEAAARSREYRYLAPHVRAVRAGGQVTRLIGAGLTNGYQADFPALASQKFASVERASKEGTNGFMSTITPEEQAICAAMGVPEDAFLRQKAANGAFRIGRSSHASIKTASGELSEDKAGICALLGVPREDYLKARAQEEEHALNARRSVQLGGPGRVTELEARIIAQTGITADAYIRVRDSIR